MNETIWPERVWSPQDLTRDFPEATSLKNIIDQATQVVEDSGEVVCEIRINGIILSENEEDKFAQNSKEEILSLSIKSQEPLKLLDESIVGCSGYIDKIMVAIEKASFLFRTADLAGANDYHSKCIQATEHFVEMITHFKIAYQTLKGGLPASWLKLEQAMLSSFTQILEGYSNKNYILVADLLEYDLSNIFASWRHELRMLEQNQIEESA